MAKDNSIAFGPSYPMDDQGGARAAQVPTVAPERTQKPMNETKIANREADLVNAWARGEVLPADPTMTTAEQTAAFTRATNAQADFAEANMSGHEQAVKYAKSVNKNGTAAGKTAFTGSAAPTSGRVAPTGTPEQQQLAQATEQAKKYAAKMNKGGK